MIKNDTIRESWGSAYIRKDGKKNRFGGLGM